MPLSTIFQLYRGSHVYRWRKHVYPEKTSAVDSNWTLNFSNDRHWFHLQILNRSTILKWTNMVWIQSESYQAKNILFGINSDKTVHDCLHNHTRINEALPTYT